MISKQLVLFTSSLFLGAQGAALADSYEAWYEAATDVPKSTVIPAKVHTYYDGKKFYTKTTSALGDTIGYFVEFPIDPSTAEFVQNVGAKSLGKKTVKGKECQGYEFVDPFEKRTTENWFDDTGKLYYQLVNKLNGGDGRYEQTRTNYKLNPQTCTLPTDPDIMPSGNADETTTPVTVPVNSDRSPFTETGNEKTNLKKPSSDK